LGSIQGAYNLINSWNFAKPLLQIGPVSVLHPVVLAPMSGVTDIVFRRIAVRLGAGLAVSEMVASRELATGDQEARLRAEGNDMGIHVVQLAGREAKWMAEAARVAEASGANIVDINMGCPVKKVTGGQSGSALMKDLDHALSLIEATVRAVSVPVTLKMRLGWDNTSICAPDLARRAEAAGICLVTVHGRTREQFFTGKADWAAIRAVKQAVSIPVIANGDVNAIDDAPVMLNASGADAVMIGRGAQGRPWFPGQVARFLATGERTAAPALTDQHVIAREHYEGLLTLYGRETGLRHARKHLGWYLDEAARSVNQTLDPAAKAGVLMATTPEDAQMKLAKAYESLAWRAAA
jgi:nifR3 family TIM-barrel protein